MTIAIGVVANNGIVLAADSEETIGYLKRDETKIVIGMGYEKSMVAVSGAGHAHYLDKVNSAITDIVMKSNKDELQDVEDKIQEYLKQFYREHILPFASYPAEERPDISLVIAGSSKWGRALWTTSSNVVKRQTGYGAVGVGGFFATSMLSRLYFPTDIGPLSILAAYVMFHVKKTIPDCGKDTHLVCIGDQNYQALPLHEMRMLEETFRFYASVERDTFHYAVGITDETTSPQKHLEHARDRILKVVAMMRS